VDNSIPLVEADRGGQATCHGPGQLIGDLVINLRERGPGDVARRLEHGLISALDALDFPAVRRETPRDTAVFMGVLGGPLSRMQWSNAPTAGAG